MALTFRDNNLAPLSYDEMDSNFRYFTGSFENSGSITAASFTSSGNISASADVYGVTGSFLHLEGDGSQLTGVTSEWDGSRNGDASITGSLTVTGGVSSSVSLNDGETIEALNGGGQLDLRANNTDGVIVLNTSASNYASSYLYMTPGLSGEVYLQGQNVNNYLSLGNNEINIVTENGLIFSGSMIRPFGQNVTDIGMPTRLFKTIYGVTGSFDYLKNSNSSTITVQDSITFQSSITASGDISSSADIYGVTGSFSHLLGASPLTIESDNFNVDSSGNITSSANISASGDLYGDNLIVGNDATFDGNITQLAGSGTTQTIANAGGVSTTNTTLTTVATLGLLLFKINTFNVKVQCKDQANSDNGGYWNLVGTFSRGLAVNQIGTTTILASHEWDGSLDVNLNIVGTNVEVQVNGLTGTNITWYCTYDRISMI